MNAKQVLALVFAGLFLVVFVLVNWKGNAFLRLPQLTRAIIAFGVWSVLAALVLAAHVVGS